jgi:ATP-dependent Clp protease adapter protein ClpS
MIIVPSETGNVKKAKKIGIIVTHDEFNSYEFLTEVLCQVLGYELSQSANCAHIIMEKGSYVVKTFDQKDLEKASAYKDILHDHQVPAKIIPL